MSDATFDAQVGKARVIFKYSNDPDQRIKDLSDAVGLLAEAGRAAVAMLNRQPEPEDESQWIVMTEDSDDQ